MDIMERCNKAVSLQSEIFKLIRDNDKNRYIYEQKLNQLKNKFNTIKNSYTDEVRKLERYNLEYMFLFEQYNLNRMNVEYKLKEINLYDKRLKKFSEHINTRKVGRVLDVKKTFYEFNGLVQMEIVCSYEAKIQLLRQRKIMSDRFNQYLDKLEEKNIDEYNEKLPLAYSKNEILAIDENKNKEKKEQQIVVEVLKSDHFDVSDDVVMSMELASPDISLVSQKMYPNLKDKLLQFNEREKIVQFNQRENDDNKKSRAV